MDSSKHTFQEIAHLILLSRYGKAEKWQILELEEWLKKSEENRNFYDKVLSRTWKRDWKSIFNMMRMMLGNN